MKHAGFAAALAATLQEERRIGPPEPRDAKSARYIHPPDESRFTVADGVALGSKVDEMPDVDLKGRDDPLTTAISTLCGRLDAVEQQMTEVRDNIGAWQEALDDQAHHTHDELHDPQVARSLLDLNERLQRLEKQVAFMASAQAMQERQIRLHTRSTAADLAIKGAVPGDLAMQTAMADAWLAWLNAGVT